VLRTLAAIGLAVLVSVLMLGCGGSKDRSHEALQPAGEPNPDLPVASPGGTGGPGGGEPVTSGESE
jgi:hypothetical protein